MGPPDKATTMGTCRSAPGTDDVGTTPNYCRWRGHRSSRSMIEFNKFKSCLRQIRPGRIHAGARVGALTESDAFATANETGVTGITSVSPGV